jgi:ComF family protein
LARSACLYEGALKEMVHAFKYGNRRSLARPLAGLMSDLLKYESALTGGVEAVTFVPLHPRRLAERDFNQSELLARLMAAALELPFASCLEKIKNTGHQNELPREKRLHNLKGAFRAKSGGRKFITGASVLLIDDVMTTGATLDECSRTLLEAGAREVRCATLARGI